MQIKIGARGVRRFLVEHEPGVDRITVEAECIDWDAAPERRRPVSSGPIFDEREREELSKVIQELWFGKGVQP